MADGNCQSVGSVCLGNLRQCEKHFHHMLHLLFSRFTVPDDCLLYLQGAVFVDRKPGAHSGNNCRSPCLSQFQGALDIVGEKNVLYCYRIRSVTADDCTEAVKNQFEPLRETGSFVGEYGTIVDMHKAVPLLANDAVAGDARTWVDAEYDHLHQFFHLFS